VAGTATFRFYAELDDLLAAERRGGDVRYPFTVAPTVKDAVEALGVPHTEVDAVVVDGRPADFGHRLGDGERIAVYPRFRRLDVGPVAKVRPPPLGTVRFVADVHLAALARYLRLLGFDTVCDPGSDDEDLAERSATEARVLLTRDRGLLKRSRVVHGLLVRADDPDEQLLEVVAALDLAGGARPFTRCMACNGVLDDVAPEAVADRVGARTLAAFDRFRRCRSCGRAYWEGSHHDRLRALVARATGADREQ
jgi:uncharacterized protein with PIN domain